MLRLSRVGADRLGAEAEDVALLDEEPDRVDVRAGRVLAGLVVVLVHFFGNCQSAANGINAYLDGFAKFFANFLEIIAY